jgi:hypothetical protein
MATKFFTDFINNNLIPHPHSYEPLSVVYYEIKNLGQYTKEEFIKFLNDNNYILENKRVNYISYTQKEKFLCGYKFKENYIFTPDIKKLRDRKITTNLNFSSDDE